ncbi:MAG: FGGY-family carbohydrate kinase, partial [Atribacterota bacterium]|nr:FGGY-family carbohydrate kinase [Atribacterota bacterium]
APFTSLDGRIEETNFKILDKEASIIKPGSDGLLILPYFMGERTPIWDANAKGTIFGLTLHHSRGFIFRALLESVAYSLRHIIESSDVDLCVDAKCVITGGVTNSKLWMEIFADVTGIPIVCTKRNVQAPLGDALVAGVATGLIKDYSVIYDWIKYDEPICPNKKNHEIYDKYFKRYKDLYISLKENMKELTNIN